MRGLLRYWINSAWSASYSRQRVRFESALENAAQTQSRYLLQLLRSNARARFGVKHQFERIRSVSEYQAQVPISNYEAMASDIDAIARGEPAILTAGPVTRFQPTSGSQSATKHIPWTSALAREFRRGIAPWIAALYQRKPALLRGTAYWSVSPPSIPHQLRGQMPVGFDHDAEYLGFWGRKLFGFVSAAPPDIVRCREIAEFKTRTLASLLADPDLALISVWSPTFLTTLLDEFIARQDEIINRVRDCGRAGARRRADFLSALLRNGKTDCFEQAWPRLQIISCWTHGPSELYAQNLRRYFPSVEIQGKGLVATEAFVSLPFQEDLDPVLAVDSHFFEFQDPVTEKIFLARELAVDTTCRIIVTTGGGLYRYALGDLVRVTGFIHDTPCLRFLGREGNTSDLFGEKLNGIFVEQLVRRLLQQHQLKARFFLLAPVVDAAAKTGYTLFLEADSIPDAPELQRQLENGLNGNFHYAHCRRLGQLGEARIFKIEPAALTSEEIFQRTLVQRGQKLGDIKIAALDSDTGWQKRFSGHVAV